MEDQSIHTSFPDLKTEESAVLKRVVSTIGELPASPAIITAVMNMTSNLDSNVAEVSHWLSVDSTLTAKVLKLANSSYYGRPKEVHSVKEAILILGFYTVRTLVIASSARSLFAADDENGPVDKLWRHSFSTAIAARQIATYLHHPHKEEIFIAALMHDIGKLVMLENLGSRYREIISRIESTCGSFVRMEKEALGFTHVDVSGLLTKQWSLPVGLVEAIAGHHTLPGYRPDQPIPMAYVVHLANLMAKRLNVSFSDGKEEFLERAESAQAMRLDAETLEDILTSVRDYYTSEIRILDEQ